MIDYIEPLCQEWGRARHGIDNAKGNPASIWGRMKEGWSIAAAEHTQRPCPPEVMLNGALAVSIALKRALEAKAMTEKQHRVMYAHYAIRGPAKRKAYYLNLSRKCYYDILHRCHRVIRFYLPEEHQRNEIVACHGDKIKQQATA